MDFWFGAGEFIMGWGNDGCGRMLMDGYGCGSTWVGDSREFAWGGRQRLSNRLPRARTVGPAVPGNRPVGNDTRDQPLRWGICEGAHQFPSEHTSKLD